MNCFQRKAVGAWGRGEDVSKECCAFLKRVESQWNHWVQQMLIEGWSYSRHVAGARDPAVSINKTDKCPALMNLVKKTGNDQIKCMGGQTDGKRERERERGQVLCRKLNMAVEYIQVGDLLS